MRAAAVAIVLLGVGPFSAAAQAAGAEVIEEASLLYEGVDTMCADFTQTLSVPLLGEESTGRGRLCTSTPNRFGMRFTDPEGDVVVNDGTFVWVYFKSTNPNSVLRTASTEAAGGHDYHRAFLVDTEERFRVSYESEDEVEGHLTHRVGLAPIGRARYRSVTVWIDRGEPILRQVRIQEANGNVRTVTLSAVDLQARPGPGWFSFTPPAGASVIEG